MLCKRQTTLFDVSFLLTDENRNVNIRAVVAEASGTIKEPVLRQLKEASALVGATITGQEKGFAVVFKIGTNGEKVLATQRGSTRLFATLSTAGAFVHDLGLPKFEVDMTGHVPGRLRKPRPDRAEAMRRTRTKLHQDSLFTEQ